MGGIEENVDVEVRSCPVCCLADIPIGHLAYHALRYGKFAIGFYREAVVEHGFNPVFYTLHDAHVIQSLYWSLFGLQLSTEELEHLGKLIPAMGRASQEYSRAHFIHSAALASEELPEDVRGTVNAYFEEIMTDFPLVGDPPEWVELMSRTVGHQGEIKGLLERLVAFTKTFTREEFSTVYCEREWRSVKPFKFTYDQVAMIVLPKVIGKTNYYDEFLKSTVRQRRIPRRIPIVPWEELVEH